MRPAPPELLVVMPVYNEQAAVRGVASEFFEEVRNWTERFVFLAIDDGSTDDTPHLLERLRARYGERFEIHRRPNRGHGQSCVEGYRIAAARGIPWTLQIDSDGQCDPRYFSHFWRLRDDADVIYGLRTRRDDGWRRVFVSWVLRAYLFVLFQTVCPDSNVPYRLLRTAAIAPHLARIPADFSLANVGLAILLRNDPSLRHAYVPFHFRERCGGEPSVKFSLFGRKAFALYWDIRRMLEH